MQGSISATAAAHSEEPEWAQWDAGGPVHAPLHPKSPHLGSEGCFPREEEASLVRQRNWDGAVGCSRAPPACDLLLFLPLQTREADKMLSPSVQKNIRSLAPRISFDAFVQIVTKFVHCFLCTASAKQPAPVNG